MATDSILPSEAAADAPREMVALANALVREAYLRKPVYADAALDVRSACARMTQAGQSWLLVRDGERLGMFTTTDLRDVVLADRAPAQMPLRDVAHFDLLTVQADDEVFEALWQMVSHHVHRLVVLEGAKVAGVLTQLDLVSFVANHSHLIALQLDDAASIDELADVASRMDQTIVSLHAGGMPVQRIARLVGGLNVRLFRRAWTLIAPPEVVANTCLVVMGSEGRGEQIFKTDQDNALIVRDGFEHPDLVGAAERFNAALTRFGYPPCPGNVMVTNPQWRQPLVRFKESIRGWLYGGDAEGPMHLAIFLDSVAVAGDAALLEQARAWLEELLSSNDTYLARFAAAVERFAESGNWMTRMVGIGKDRPLDLKKLAIFPIVHGVRALALEQRLRERSTASRLNALRERGVLAAPLARDLVATLHDMMRLRLDRQLAARASEEAPDNTIRTDTLSPLERERLDAALHVVRSFKAFLRQHFRFDAL